MNLWQALETITDFFKLRNDEMPEETTMLAPSIMRSPDLSDLYITEQLDSYDYDTGIVCEYTDVDGKAGVGVIIDWGSNPYDLYDMSDSQDYAYIVTEQGGATYAHISELIVLEGIIGYEDSTEQLPELQPSVEQYGALATSGNYYRVPAMPDTTS